MATLAVVPTLSDFTLYDIQEEVAALLDTQDLVSPEREAEFLEHLSTALLARGEKLDATGWFLAHMESQADLARTEAKRLLARAADFDAAIERLEGYIVRIIKHMGLDKKGKYQKLEGPTVTFGLHKCPASIETLDESLVPDPYKAATITLKMPVTEWEELLDSLDLETRALILDRAKRDYAVDKRAAKAALESGEAVPGAKLADEKYTLQRK